MTSSAKKKGLGAVAFAYVLAMLVIFGCSREQPDGEPLSVANGSSDAPVPSDSSWKEAVACLKCHADSHAAWVASHHAKANRPVDPSVDGPRYSVGPFEDEAGNRYQVASEGGRLLLSEQNAEGDYVAAEAEAVIGFTPLQQPLVKGERGRWQAHTMAWDPDKEEWFNVFGAEERTPGDWGHWTGQGMNWNSNCAWCHTTEYEKNYDAESDAYASSWTFQGISCISCHTGMQDHAAEANAGGKMVSKSAAPEAVMANCASCHARREQLTDGAFKAGDRFDDHFRLVLYDHPTAYFEDGKADEENFVFGSFMHSKMGHAGVTCMDCHDPHSLELKLPANNNALCIQCHSTGRLGAQIVDLAQHSHHPIGSSGDSCVQCHMPERAYMARDPRRDHGFTIPDPYMGQRFGVPDACTSCHSDADADGLLEWFNEKWGDSPRIADLRDRANMLNAAWTGQLQDPSALLERFHGSQNPYWKASWLRMARPFAQVAAVREAAMSALNAKQAVLRDAAVFILGAAAAPDLAESLAKALEDPSLSVRMQAADALAGSPLLGGEALDEYNAYLEANADRPSGALKLATRAAERNEPDAVRRYGLLAISFDRRSAAIRFDVAILMDRVGLADEAIKQLRIAHGYDPSTGLYLYSTGLLLAGKGQVDQAVEAMQRALRIEPEQHRWLYNLSILQARSGDLPGAQDSLYAALQLAPEEPAYLAFWNELAVATGAGGR